MRWGMLASAAALVLGAGAAQAQPVLHAVGIENEYADVMSQIGGPYVRVSAIVTDPNTDPHEFEISPQVAGELASADVVVENGLGYDGWADKLLSGTHATVISAQRVRNLPNSTPNPHLWYDPATMPAVAKAVADAFATKDPAHAAYYQGQVTVFDASLKPWLDELAQVKAHYAGTPVAVSEPVADYLLQAAGMKILTPFTLEEAAMNGTDPAPQDVSTQQDLLVSRKVAVYVFNQQVQDTLSDSFRALAQQSNLRVLGVYETMPKRAKSYQNWMLGETKTLAEDLAAGGQ
ncbi:metal ABC transporter solute-binding protein, Zn/Mn family [Acidocella aromatica]|uniref:Zinc/manganese transport system substrate-binding protein n=1 Tax=Acidocella aromatica TaxID=1303579 RepID=A0A840VPT9_9PROT|nr:zinc ABC transporter substrate-binding protein [Acidocella aromatica]MBB5374129.1 zinc/manganese transport system substrate-binding protein [Acidocella aromatica]